MICIAIVYCGFTLDLLFQVVPEMYFHIKKKREVKLIEATGTDVVIPPTSAKFTYYKTECTYPQVSN